MFGCIAIKNLPPDWGIRRGIMAMCAAGFNGELGPIFGQVAGTLSAVGAGGDNTPARRSIATNRGVLVWWLFELRHRGRLPSQAGAKGDALDNQAGLAGVGGGEGIGGDFAGRQGIAALSPAR